MAQSAGSATIMTSATNQNPKSGYSRFPNLIKKQIKLT
jgi:hypothetical protein